MFNEEKSLFLRFEEQVLLMATGIKTAVVLIIFLAGTTCISSGFAQDKKAEKELLADADSYFKNENHLAALPLYLELLAAHPNDIGLKFKTGVCYLSKTDEFERAVIYLEQVRDKKPKTKGLDYYLAKAYMLNYRFDEAVELANKAMKEKKLDEERQKDAERLLMNCENATKLMAEPLNVNIENIGGEINTAGSEYAPVISADESVLIYTYRGERSVGGLQNEYAEPDPRGQYYEDIFITYRVGSSWLPPDGIETINTPWHDASIGLTPDGHKLLIYRDTKVASGDIFVSELNSNMWTTPERLDTNINSRFWEGRGSLSADEKTLFFSSKRPGGFGGRDIYRAELREDGTWSEAQNAGPQINTVYDDDAPFFHPDGKTLYFSSQGHTSMGGYDVFRTELQPDGTFSEPDNIGYPVNTTGNDVYYVVSADGKTGYYSSGRAGGYGQQDIYTVRPASPTRQHALVLVKGTVTVDDEPAEAKITVTYSDDNSPQSEHKSNSATGKYLVNLPVDSRYNITYEAEGFEPRVEFVDATGVVEYMEKIIDVAFNTPKFEYEALAPDIPRLDTMDLSDPDIYQKILELYGDVQVEGLIYRVQIGAYLSPQNFNYSKEAELWKVETDLLPDGITRFVLGDFSTLNKAEEMKQKVLAVGNREYPFIIIFYNNDQVRLRELIVAPKGLLYRNVFFGNEGKGE